MNGVETSLGPPTRFDINFRLGDIPVRVHPFFWLTTVAMGWDPNPALPGSEKLKQILVWAAVVFVSILVHELGHVLMGRYFGSRGHILLTGFCGLAIGSADLPERWQRNSVSLAGPGAGFVLAAVVFAVSWLIYPQTTLALLAWLVHLEVEVAEIGPHRLVEFAILQLLFVNIFWGLVNLLPIWPLDGGQVSREVCEQYRGREGFHTALMISIAVSGGLGALALLEMILNKPLLFGATLAPVIFFGILCGLSAYLLHVLRKVGLDWDQPDEEPRAPWEQDADWWKQGGNSWRD